MSKFLEDIKWQWEMQHSFSADKWEEMFCRLEKGEQLKAENEELKEWRRRYDAGAAERE